MAPLPAALASPTTAPPKGGSAGSAPSGGSTPFAQLLGPGEDGAGVSGTTGATGHGAGAPASSRELLPEGADPAAEDVLAAATGVMQALAPDAPWPPAGLGGLFQGAAGIGVQPGSEADASGGIARTRGALQGPANGALSTALHPAGGAPGGLPTGEGSDLATPSLVDAAFAAAAAAGDPDALAVAGTNAPLSEGAEPSAPVFSLPQAQMPTAREPAPLLAAPAPTPDVRNGDFSERFGAQLQWMAGQNIGHARIQVTPHDLGPVEVMLRMEGDSISAEFVSAHAETRQALEQGLPRLRDLLGEHGFQLAHAGVGSDAPASRDGERAASGAGTPAGSDGRGDAGAPADAPATVRTLRGLVDAYA